MAKATFKTVIEKEVVETEKEVNKYNLELNESEAKYLLQLLGREWHQDAQEPQYGIYTEIANALRRNKGI